jgi:pimeloyl-ACP methyl ester carboxylesterase
MKTKAHHNTIHRAAFLSILALFLALLPFRASAASDGVDQNSLTKPTLVLVHGAFAGSSSWNAVTELLLGKGYHVVAVANPLRGLRSDSEYLATLLQSIQGPIVLAGHSYGGCVISNAAENNSNVKALVFVAAVAPDEGESLVGLTGRLSRKYAGRHARPGFAARREQGPLCPTG